MDERPAHSKLNKQADVTLQLSETVSEFTFPLS